MPVAFRLFLLQPMGAYCVSLAQANVESCAPASPLSSCPPGEGDDILWGCEEAYQNSLHHASSNPHSLHLNRGISTCEFHMLESTVLAFCSSLHFQLCFKQHLHIFFFEDQFSCFAVCDTASDCITLCWQRITLAMLFHCADNNGFPLCG